MTATGSHNRVMPRSVPFEHGRRYVALRTFDSFVAGRVYRYRWSDYNYRDGETRATFYDSDQDREHDWSWFDNEPDSLCDERFRLQPA